MFKKTWTYKCEWIICPTVARTAWWVHVVVLKWFLGTQKKGLFTPTRMLTDKLPYVLSTYELGSFAGQKIAEHMDTDFELHVPWSKVQSRPQTLLPPPPHSVLLLIIKASRALLIACPVQTIKIKLGKNGEHAFRLFLFEQYNTMHKNFYLVLVWKNLTSKRKFLNIAKDHNDQSQKCLVGLSL